MTIGTYGGVVFEVSANKTLTFQRLSENAGAKFAAVNLLRGKPRSQYIGANLQTVDIEILLRADLGIKPREAIQRLKSLSEEGEAEMLVIAGQPVTDLPLVITSMSAAWDIVYRAGELWQTTVKLTLEEYR